MSKHEVVLKYKRNERQRTVQYFLMQDPEDKTPWGVARMDDDSESFGTPELYLPGEGNFADWPSLVPYFFNGEPGANPATEAEARKAMEKGVGPDAKAVAKVRDLLHAKEISDPAAVS